MASTINSDDGIISGIPGLKYSADTSGALVLQTNGTTAITISASQVVTFAGAVSLGALTTSGNLTFTSTGNRILGDFSNATTASRVLFQTSTTNSTTSVGIIPNGTATQSLLELYNNGTDLANVSRLNITALATEVSFRSSTNGTGTYLPITFYTNGSERMRLDTSGRLLIGTATANGIVTVVGASQMSHSYTGAVGRMDFGQYNSSGDASINNTSNANLLFATNNTERMRIDSSGNVGISTTPSAWGGSFKALQLGGPGAIWFPPTGTGSVFVSNNTYYDGSAFKYINTGASSYLALASDNVLSFNQAPSGTAGSSITYVNSFRIDASGNVGVGTTPSAWAAGSGVVQNAGGALWQYGSQNVYLGQNYYWNGSNRIYIASLAATEFQQSNGVFRWYNAPTGTAGATANLAEALRLNENSTLILKGGNVSASGIGITFPASQAASADANTLDDYEEGTWTPSFASTGATFSNAGDTFASYTKIGNVVNASAYLHLSSVSGTTSNAVGISGLPFASKNGCSASGSFGVEQFSVRPTLFIDRTTSTTASIYQAGTVSNMLTSNLNTTGYYLFTITYQSAS